jgi:endoglucanase
MAAMMTAAAIGGCSSSSSDSNSTTEAPTQDSATAGENTDDTSAAAPDETEGDSQGEDDNSGEAEVHTSKNGIETKDNGVVRTDLTALELSYLMGNGINLGNTMEAVNTALGYGKDTSFYETCWGQPVTTQEMITGMKEAGFDTIRIPVAWVSNAMENYADGDYTISEAELNRVEEIMNYALNEDMYVIINDHWDGGWWGMFGSATEETRDAAMDLYVSMWTQIAERYAEYGDHVIFESANEELGSSLNLKTIAEDSGTLSEAELYETTNKINQTFVDTIRATGGNNENRFLLIAGYNTNIDLTCNDKFVMPTDTADSKLFVSVHYYDPWNYCGDGTAVTHWGTKKEYENMNTSLAEMTKFTEQGYGVIIGEYGVLINGETDEERGNTTDFIGNFLDNCDQYNYVSCLWDCSTLYNRKESSMRFDDTAELFVNRSFASQAEEGQDAEIEAAAKSIEDSYEEAPVSMANPDYDPNDHDTATAWIMWNSGDYGISYSVGDEYNPDNISDGLVAGVVEVAGEGTYTVSLDFTGTGAGSSNGTAFSAIGIYNGEVLYPGYYMVITSCKINGEEYEFLEQPYTTNDNEYTTRVNLYNQWVSSLPDEARVVSGDLDGCGPCILDANVQADTIEITFDYVAPEHADEYNEDRAGWVLHELQ